MRKLDLRIDPNDPMSDFRNFLYLVWKFLGLPDPSPRQYAIAHYLQTGRNKRRMVQAFRGFGKSWITGAFVAWLLYRNPHLNIMVVSAGKSRAVMFTNFVLRLLKEMPMLQHLAPTDEQRRSMEAFDVAPAGISQTPSVVSVGIFGQITGNRADVLIADDVEIPRNSETVAMRLKLSEAVKEFDAVIKPGGHIIYLGTPQTGSTIYKELPKRGYTIRIWPVRFPNDEQVRLYGEQLAEDIIAERCPENIGKTTEARFTDLEIAEREASYGRLSFNRQFMLLIAEELADRFPLKLADLPVLPLDPEVAPDQVFWSATSDTMLKDAPMPGQEGDAWYHAVVPSGSPFTNYTSIVMAIDPSGRGKDELGYAIVALSHARLFLLDAGGMKGGYAEQNLQTLANLAKRWQVNKIIIEANFGDGMFTQLMKPILQATYPVVVEEVKHSRQKEARILDTLEPVISRHKLIVNQFLIKKDFDSVNEYGVESDEATYYRLFYQLTNIMQERGCLAHDDRLDALAIAVAYFTEKLHGDSDKLAAKAEESRFLTNLLKFMGGRKTNPNFVNRSR